MIGGPVDHHQLSVLRRRYTSILLSDANSLVMLVLQVVLIGGAIVGVWLNVSGDTLSLYFVLCLCSFFFGSINSCREVVKERVLFLREKMFNLSVSAYLLSKYWIQNIVLALQCIVLGITVDVFIPLDVPSFVIILVMFAVGSVGVSIGLLVSSWVRSSDRAVVCVPLLVIPQILFSDFVLGSEQLHNWTGYAQNLMPVYWGYELLKTWWNNDQTLYLVFCSVIPLSMMVLFSYVLTLIRLERTTE